MDSYFIAGIGSFISILLMINAHFTRKTLEKINAVDLKLAVLITDHKHTEKKTEKNEEEIKQLKDGLATLRDEMKRDYGRLKERVLTLEAHNVNPSLHSSVLHYTYSDRLAYDDAYLWHRSVNSRMSMCSPLHFSESPNTRR